MAMKSVLELNASGEFPGNFAIVLGLNRPNNKRDNNHGETIHLHSIGSVRIRFWLIAAFECRH